MVTVPKVVETITNTDVVESRNSRSRSLGLKAGSRTTSNAVKTAPNTGSSTTSCIDTEMLMMRTMTLYTEMTGAEREPRSIQTREDRAITLFVTGRNTQAQLDKQRKSWSTDLRTSERSWTITVPGHRSPLRNCGPRRLSLHGRGTSARAWTSRPLNSGRRFYRWSWKKSSSTGTTTWPSRWLYPFKVNPLRRMPCPYKLKNLHG